MAAPSGVHFSTTEDVPGTSLEAKAGSSGSLRGSHNNGVDMTPRLFSSKSAKMIGGVELGGPPPPPPLMHRGSSKFSAAAQELSGSDTDDAEDDANLIELDQEEFMQVCVCTCLCVLYPIVVDSVLSLSLYN